MMQQEPLFYIRREEGEKAGPYDLVQLAGLLRKKIISPETMTCLEGTEDWKAFSWQPQFSVVREIPPDAVSNRLTELEEKELEARSGPIPMPSPETVMKLAGLICATVLAGTASFVLACLDQTTGYFVIAVGAAAAAVASCMIISRLLDEDAWTLLKIFFLPFGNSFYFISNFWVYFPWFFVRYVGTAMVLGALVGLEMRGRR